MLGWYTAHAPIRRKLFIAFGVMVTLLATLAGVVYWQFGVLEPLIGGGNASALRTAFAASTQIVEMTALGCIGVAIVLAVMFRAAIANPYVSTVVRMEALAAGDLDSPIAYSDFTDCVGRMTKAMQKFRANEIARRDAEGNREALAEQARAEQAAIIADSVGAGLEALARGDLTHRVNAQLDGAFGKLKDNFNAASSRLQETIKNVLSGTAGIGTGAGEIARAADDLSRRTEQQAANLEETAAALEQITATVNKTAQNAKEASVIVGTAKAAAEDGGRVVETAIKAMGQIEQSSKQITDIIAVIDEIAFQTNLLALNAGVEAARAGDAGKGFAVVASEVRALAQRSSEAAKEIKTLIKASGEHVGAGVKSVGESGQALKRIVDQVVAINSLMNDMTQATQQQSTGIEEVNAAVAQMDQVTQQNAAMVEQSTAASRNLATETSDLVQLVSFFQVGEPPPNRAKAERAPRVSTPAPRAANRPAVRKSGGPALAAASAPSEDEWKEF